ncbi:transglutaminaseTgpA domain-containing protein [Colwelliaceae bacterium 6471]
MSGNYRFTRLANDFSLAPKVAWLLLLCLCINIAMLSSEITLWMITIIVLCLIWRGLMTYKKVVAPPKWLLVISALFGCVALALAARQLGLLLTMLHLLVFSYALKSLEMHTRKDFFQLFLLGLFVLASALIFSQTLLFSLLVIALLIINFGVLLSYFAPPLTIDKSVLTVSKLLVQSIPLAVVLFVIFPRLLPFWQVPLSNSAKTGLSDTVAPGDIASLALSSDLAFRADFDGNTPLSSQLYWRALVLESYDGRRWQLHPDSIDVTKKRMRAGASSSPNSAVGAFNASGTNSYDYQVIVEPSYQHWLFALDVAYVDDPNIVILPDHSLRSIKPVTQTQSYQVSSDISKPMDLVLPLRLKERNLYYPLGSNPRLEQMAKQLLATSSSDQALIQAVLQQIRQQSYRYTLQPPTLTNNSLDEFYFDTKAGFCVHYASAFTFLMRAAGIPARMVTGYLGGEYNPQGQYYSIFQYDAHAWSEVWIAGKGWQRVDPTAAVSPDRVEKGFSAILAQQQSLLSNDFFNLQRYQQFSWLNDVRLQLEAIDYQWTKWVIGFTAQRQYDLLTRWFGEIKTLTFVLLLSVTFIGGLFLLWLVNKNWRDQQKFPLPLALYLQGVALLAKKGLVKPKAMPAMAFSHQVSQQLPQIAELFQQFSWSFYRLQYQALSEENVAQTISEMKKQLKAMKQALKHS